MGLPRPAHPAGRDARDDRGARGRHRARPRALPPADPGRGRPDGADGRRPLRALPHPRRRAAARARSRVVLGDLVSEAIAGAEPVARARGVRLGGSVEQGLQVVADPAGLSRVLANLIMNAHPAHALRRHGQDPRPRDRADGVELSVTDGCGGIPDADLARVFDVAWRGERGPHSRRAGGTRFAREPASAWRSSRGSSRRTRARCRSTTSPCRAAAHRVPAWSSCRCEVLRGSRVPARRDPSSGWHPDLPGRCNGPEVMQRPRRYAAARL